MPIQTYRLVLISDDTDRARGIEDALTGEADFTLVATCDPTGAEQALARATGCDTALLDLASEGASAACSARLLALVPSLAIVALAPGADRGRTAVGDALERLRLGRRLADRTLAVEELQAQLLSAQEELHALRLDRETLLGNLSEEIRPPLAAILDVTTLLLAAPLGDDQRDFAKTIRASGAHALAIVTDVVDLAHLASGKLDVARGPFSPRACLEEALELIARPAAERENEITYTIPRSVPAVILGDEARTRRALVDVMSHVNRVARRGSVRVGVTERALGEGRSELKFSVNCAAGCPELLSAESPRLDLSRRFAHLVGGTIGVEGRGPQASAYLSFVATVVERSEPERAPMALGVLERKRVLLVDDHAFSREVLAAYFRSWSVQTIEAATPQEGLVLLGSSGPFDLVLIDLLMPEMDGVDLAKAIKAREPTRDLPLVLMSATSNVLAARERAKDLFEGFVTKPIRPSQLFNVVHEVLQRKLTRVPRRSMSERFPGAAFDPSLGKTHPLRILVAEDNITNQRVARAMLDRLGYSADFVASGAEAIEAAARKAYDAIFMDVQMPGCDGLEATRRICAAWSKGLRPRIIAMTADSLDEDRAACTAAGMDDYLRKPITREGLVVALRACSRSGRED